MANKTEKFTSEELGIEKGLTEKKEEAVEKIPEREIITERALSRLEEKDYIEFGPDQGIICDLGKLKNIPLQDVEKLGLIFKSKYYGHKQKGRTLFEVFRDKNVIAKKDYEKGNLEAKPLFYVPKNQEEAFNPEFIKKQDFHLGLWEVYRKTPLKEIYPSCEDKTNLFEASVAAIIYHPKYGDGRRDKKGNLLARDLKTREYQKINTTFFKKIGLWGNPVKVGKSFGTPRLFLRTKLKRLAEKGLLVPTDFRVQTGYVTAEKERLERSKVDPRGGLTLYGVTHYLGREFIGRDINIYELEKGLGGITEKDEKGREKISYTFNIFEKDPHFLTKGGYYVAKKEDVDLKEYAPETFSRRRADETKEEYQKRVKAVENWEFLLKFSEDLSEKTGINLSRLSFREQKFLSASVASIKEHYDDVLEFAKIYGKEGLRTFISCEYNLGHGRKILEIGKLLPEKQAEEIFSEYGKIINQAEKFGDLFRNTAKLDKSDLPEEIKKDFPNEISEAILRRAKDLLIANYPISVEKVKTELSSKDVKNALYGFRTFLEVVQSFEKKDSLYKISPLSSMGSSYSFEVLNRDTDEKYKLNIFVRPRKTEKGQARINFELRFDTDNPNETLKQAFHQEVYYKKKDERITRSVLRIGIDREERGSKEEISLDLGRDKYEDDILKRSGDVMGNVLALTTETGHHNPKSFKPEYAKEETFAGITELFREYLEKKVKKK